ncbi:MAG: cellulose binding domain-containing protein [Terracidiphilus sp.]
MQFTFGNSNPLARARFRTRHNLPVLAILALVFSSSAAWAQGADYRHTNGNQTSSLKQSELESIQYPLGGGGSSGGGSSTPDFTVSPLNSTVSISPGSSIASANLIMVADDGASAPGFTLLPSQSILSMANGSSTSITITVKGINGFTSPVTLSPDMGSSAYGITAVFSTNPTSDSSVLTVTASGTTPAQIYPITVVGSSGTLSASITILVNILPTIGGPSFFEIGSDPAMFQIPQGGIATSTLTVEPINGFTGNVTLSVGPLPQGVTYAIEYNPLSPSNYSTPMDIKVAPDAALGDFSITVTGSSNGQIASTVIMISIIPATTNFTLSSSVPELDMPQNGISTFAITVNPLNGFTGSVALSVGYLTPGVSYSLQSNSVTSSTMLTIITSSTAEVGNFGLFITGISGGQGTTLLIPVNIGEPAGFNDVFRLLPLPTGLNITPGSSEPVEISVNPAQGGVPSTVTLSAFGEANGISVAFDTNPTNTSSNMTVTASPNAPVGTSSYLYVQGFDGENSADSFVMVNINEASAAPNYKSGSLSPSVQVTPLVVPAAQSTTLTKSNQATNTSGVNGSVALSVSGLPPGVTGVFSTGSTTGSSVLSLTASPNAAPGLYAVTVTGSSGSITHNSFFNLRITPDDIAPACHVGYTINGQWPGGFNAGLNIENTGTTAISNWTLTWSFANGQTIPAGSLWNGNVTQSGANVTVTNESWNGSIAAGATLTGVGFNGTWNGATNAVPTNFAINGTACSVN